MGNFRKLVFDDKLKHIRLVVNDLEAVAPVTLRPKRMNDEKFLALCVQYPDCRLERKANGKIVILPPCGGETGFRNSQLTTQLNVWALKTGDGRALDSSTGFVLADRSILGPDASWVSKAKLAKLTKRQQEQFLPLCPEFVVELTSPSNRLKKVQAKMLDWMNNGALLGWLLDASERTAYIYRPGQAPEKIVQPTHFDRRGPGGRIRLGSDRNLGRIFGRKLKNMQLVVNDLEAVAPVTLRPKRMNDEKFLALCVQYPDYRLERKANGKIVIMSPCGLETGDRNAELTSQLRAWALARGSGRALDSSAGFVLPDRSIKSPDASWVSETQWSRLTKSQRSKFAPFAPEFVV